MAKQLNDRRIKEAVFVFLHGPKAYTDESWKTILLDVLHSVGFEANELAYEKKLSLEKVVRSSGLCGEGIVNDAVVIGARLESHPVAFGVIVKAGDGWNNERAIRWLNDIAFQISGMRIGYLVRKKLSQDEARAQFKQHIEILNAGGSLEAFSEEKDAISHDPKTLEAFELMADGASDVFSEFFQKAIERLRELIAKSISLEPITLTDEGDRFIQTDPPGLHDNHLRDDMSVKNVSGIHQTCGGVIRFIQTTETRITAVCDKCFLRVPIASSSTLTFAHLRDRVRWFGRA